MTRQRRIRLLFVLGLVLSLLAAAGLRFRTGGLQASFAEVWDLLEARDLEGARRRIVGMPRSGADADAELLRGTLLLREGRADQALAVFARLDPTSARREQVHQVTGEALVALGRLAEARTVLVPLTQEWPSNAAGRRALAIVYYDLGANDLALIELEALKNLAPDDFRPWHLAGRMYTDFEQYADAILNCEGALARKPAAATASEIRECLASCYIATHRAEEALTLLKDEPDTFAVLLRRAEALLALERIPEARKAAEAARAMDSKSCAASSLLARVSIDEGKTEEGAALLEELLGRCPHEFRDRYRLAQALQKLGRKDEAVREMTAYEASQELYKSLVELNAKAIEEPDNAAVRRELAKVCRQLGKDQLAEVWERAAGSVVGPDGAITP
jgi:predicted Zn-dependent protease